MSDNDVFYFQPLDNENLADLLRDVAATASTFTDGGTELFGIVSEHDGGIIAYAIGLDHANQIIAALDSEATR